MRKEGVTDAADRTDTWSQGRTNRCETIRCKPGNLAPREVPSREWVEPVRAQWRWRWCRSGRWVCSCWRGSWWCVWLCGSLGGSFGPWEW